MTNTRRVPGSGLTVLAAAVLVLLPALAWLQYSWLNQIADADRERRTRTLDTAAAQMSHELESELSRAFFGLQIDPSIVETRAWAAYEQRYETWSANALHSEIVEDVYFVAADEDLPPRTVPPLRLWNRGAKTFEDIAWPPALEAVRTRFTAPQVTHVEMHATAGASVRSERIVMPPVIASDVRTLMAPIVRVRVPDGRDAQRGGPPDVRLLGFTLIRLNLEGVRTKLLPDLVARHFSSAEDASEFRVAVVEREDPTKVIFESEPGAAQAALASPDAEATLLSLRSNPFFLMRSGIARRDRLARIPPPGPDAGPPPSDRVVVGMVERDARRGGDVQARISNGDEARWRLVVKHRAGSLEAAVAAARTRSLALSSGILALLGAAIALIVVSARRADRLARQQVEFVAAVSHELRTPVSVIGAAAGNLADGIVGDPGRVKTYGATIQAEARRLGETVERVLQLAGIMSGRPASPETLAPHALVDAAIAACRYEIDAAGAEVEVAIEPSLPPVAGDGTALRSALQNLVSNAVKYGGNDKRVRVSAARAGTTSRPLVRFSVEDHGLGIGADDRKHIFEPFYRGREAVARQIQGSGLGLNLVQRIADAHGGTVSVVSEPGTGSTFTLTLPAAAEALASSGAAEALPAGSSLSADAGPYPAR